MNKSDLHNYCNHPATLNTAHVKELKELVQQFPYFTGARMLLCKALSNTNHYDLDAQIKKTALRVPDREVLYHYIHQPDILHALKQKHAQQPQPIAEAEAYIPNIIVESTPIIIPNEPEDHETLLSQDTSLDTHVELITNDSIIVEEVEPVVDYTAEQKVEDDIVEINQPPVELSDNIIPEQLLQDDVNAGVEETEQTVAEENNVEELMNATTDELPIINNEADESTTANEEYSFLEWLTLKAGKVEPAPVILKETKEQPKPLDNQEIQKEEIPLVQPEPKVSEEVKKEIAASVAKSNVNQFHDILDKFIKENPSISRPKAEFFNPMNMAKTSVEEDEDLVTETLAGLYYKQGNHKKAIRAYEKLCLLYPSKMTYFASLIQKIKSEIKD